MNFIPLSSFKCLFWTEGYCWRGERWTEGKIWFEGKPDYTATPKGIVGISLKSLYTHLRSITRIKDLNHSSKTQVIRLEVVIIFSKDKFLSKSFFQIKENRNLRTPLIRNQCLLVLTCHYTVKLAFKYCSLNESFWKFFFLIFSNFMCNLKQVTPTLQWTWIYIFSRPLWRTQYVFLRWQNRCMLILKYASRKIN